MIEAIQKGKAVVRPDWIRDSVKKSEALPCGDYAAISDLLDSSIENCPESSSSQSQPPDQAEASTSQHQSTKESTLPDLVYEPRYKSRFACERYSPLICPNQDLVKELHIIKLAREMESEERSALSYSRAISVSVYFNCVVKTNVHQAIKGALPSFNSFARAALTRQKLSRRRSSQCHKYPISHIWVIS